MTEILDYTTIRSSVGAYSVTAPLTRLSGDDRLQLLDAFLSKASDFVEPDTTRECLALQADGSPFAIFLHLELTDSSWLLPRTPLTPEALRGYLATFDVPDDVLVEVEPAGWGAVAVEGPGAPDVVSPFVDFDISGLVLHAITEITLPDGPEGTTAHLARVGTTGEYGYLLLSDAPDDARAALITAAERAGGGVVEPAGLARVQSEAGMPYYSQGLEGLSVSEADLAWMVSWDRVGEFHGSEQLVPPDREAAKVAALTAPSGVSLAAGSPVLAGDVVVGQVTWQIPSANPDEELLFAVLQTPFWVPGVDLVAADADGDRHVLSTVTLPRILAQSTQNRLG